MALEPKRATVGADDEKNTERHDMTRRVWIGAALTFPVFPFFGWRLSPIIAGAAMSLSSVSVISNALRLRKVKL